MTTLPQYTPFYGGGQVANPANVIPTSGAPSSVLTESRLGTIAVDNTSGNIYGLASKVGNVNTWVLLGGSTGAVASVLGTANQITANTVGNVVTLSLPAAVTAPGSLTTTTSLTGGTGVTATTGNITASSGNVSASGTVTGGTGVTATTGNVSATAGAVNAGTSMTATLGNITATNGNFVASTAGTGLSLPVATASGASPQTANARVFSVTFTGVSIASGATQVFDIANTAIVGSSTVALVEWSGATAGSALSIVSQVSTAGHLTITMTNGTSATMVTSTADITFSGIVLN